MLYKIISKILTARLQSLIADVVDEIEYRKMGIVAFGINPHLNAFTGFCKRLWGDQNVDKVILIKKGVFLIRFLNQIRLLILIMLCLIEDLF